jgi:hypothetical protein
MAQTAREFIRFRNRSSNKKGLPFDHGDIVNIENYRQRMVGPLSKPGLEQEKAAFNAAVNKGIIDVVKELHRLITIPEIRERFTASIEIIEGLYRQLMWEVSLDDPAAGTEEADHLSILDLYKDERYSPEEDVLKKEETELQDTRFEKVKTLYLKFTATEFPGCPAYHTFIRGKDARELAAELQVYNPDDPENKGVHKKESNLFKDYCHMAGRTGHITEHHTLFSKKITRIFDNIKTSVRQGVER